MITALIIMHLFGGGSVEIFSRSDFKMVGQLIEETERAELILQTMEHINDRVDSVVEKRKHTFDRLVDINDDVDATEEAYDEVLDQLWQARREARDEYIDLVFVLRQNMTRAEWNATFGIIEQ